MISVYITLCPRCGTLNYIQINTYKIRWVFRNGYYTFELDYDDFYNIEFLCPNGHKELAEIEIPEKYIAKIEKMKSRDRVIKIIELIKKGEAKLKNITIEEFEKYTKEIITT